MLVPPEDNFALHAWIDESIHLDAGMYVLASAVADPSVCDRYGDSLRPLVTPPRQRLHWRDETPKDQLQIAQTVAGFDLAHVVAVAARVEKTRQERARRTCFEALLLRFAAIGVTQVWVESRGKLDRKDMKFVAVKRVELALPRALRVDFARPLEDPMLWVPDAVAGAVAAARKGKLECRDALGHSIEEVDLSVT